MHALASGFIGAVALTTIHQAARRFIPDPPRMDIVGMRALTKIYRGLGLQPPEERRLYRQTLAGDLLSNALYYSAVAGGSGRAMAGKALALGLAAGVGAVVLPEPLGLGVPPHHERLRTRLLTVAWYLTGALAAAAAAARAGGQNGQGSRIPRLPRSRGSRP